MECGDVLAAEPCESLLAAVRQAPSADNRPCFAVQWVGGSLEFRDLGDFSGPILHRRVLAWMALGAATKNAEIRAGRLGLRAGLALFDPQRTGDPIARLSFSSGEEAFDSELDEAITTRCSNRHLLFRGPALGELDRKRLSAEVALSPGARLHWFDDASRRRQALALIRCAETQRFEIETLHRELFSSIRFDVGWNASADAGIPPGALGLPLIERLGFPLLRHWWLQRLANLLGMHAVVGWRAAALPCRLSPHLCAISVGDDRGRDASIRAGAALQAAWLRATSLGLAFQVFAASPLYAMEGLQVVPNPVQTRLSEGWKRLCGEDMVYIVFRMGRAPQPAVRARRF